MKREKFYFILSSKVVLIFVVLMFGSHFGETEFARNFFGDWYCEIINKRHAVLDESSHSTPVFHWGWRHYLYMFMGLSLFTIQIIKIIFFINKNKEHVI